VGQDAIEYVGRALGVPLYRRVITGSALETSLDYGTRAGISETQVQDVDGDETEDLLRLLQEVKVAATPFT
jgi:diphthine-ammonia ligase